MRAKSALLLLLTLFILSIQAPQVTVAQDVVGDLLARVNNLRASVGRPPYSLNGALSAAANDQAVWMASTGSISHTRPDGSGPRTRAANAGYPSSMVSENIYGGGIATVNDAWVFWVNSAVHYAGMTSSNYNEIGIGASFGDLNTFVLVFGNSGGPSLAAINNAQSSGSSGGGGGVNSQPVAPISYVLGLDESGNIMHAVQPSDTLGDIALIYGYTWDDIPRMMALNDMENVRDLEVGSVFLVPARDSAPPEDVPPTPIPSATPMPYTITPYIYQSPTPIPTLIAVLPPGVSPEPTQVLATLDSSLFVPYDGTSTPMAGVAMEATSAPTATLQEASTTNVQTPQTGQTRNDNNVWIIAAVAVQGIIIFGAGFEYVRRSRNKNKVRRRFIPPPDLDIDL